MIRAISARGATRVSLRHRISILLGCTAFVALVPVFAVAQDADTDGDTTVLQTITVDGAGKAGGHKGALS